MKITYSPHNKPFKTKLEKLLRSFSSKRNKVLRKSFASLPWANLKPFLNLKKNAFKTFLIVGIGGSSLGLKALVEGLSTKKSVIFLDNTDPVFVNDQLKKITPKKTLFILISKSGETIEVLTLSKILLKFKAQHNFLVITDNKESSLGKLAKRNKIQIFTSPKNVPGRFSILSVVGMLPAILMGIEAEKTLKGAQKTGWTSAYTLACYQYLHYLHNKNITVIFPYCERLSTFGDWFVQLLSESIGKAKKIGITPIKAIGVRDQHSILQLFLDGPTDKFFIFIKPTSSLKGTKVPGEPYTFENLFDCEYEGVKQAFVKKNLPFAEIIIDELTPQTLGELFFFFELEIAFLGNLFKINIENQPAVELSKHITKQLLKQY